MYEWDEAKNTANIRKHGIGFATAVRIFDGFVVTELDPGEHDEIRERSYGMIGQTVLMVVHTDRPDRVRIISARPATRNERQRYEAYLRKRTYS